MRLFSKTVVLLFAVLPGMNAGAENLEFFVNPQGQDDWSGRRSEVPAAGQDGPFRSMERAQRAVRELKQRGRLKRPVTVFIRGTLHLSRRITFTPEDSGTEGCPVTYTSLPGERAVLSGGRRLLGWKEAGDGLWVCSLPGDLAAEVYPRQLFINGKRAVRARSPDTGFYKVQGLVNPKPGARWNEGVDRFLFKPGDIRSWKDLHNIEVVVYHSWNTSRVRIASVDETKGLVTFTGPTIFRPLGWDPQQRYYVENAMEALNSPGEWYCDSVTRRVFYRPQTGEKMNEVEAVIPVLNDLVHFQGNPDKGRFVEYVRLIALSFQHSDWTLPEKGYGDPQAAVTVPAAIMADGARNCTIEKCDIAHVGTYAVWLRRGCKNCRLVQTHIDDMGAGGVRLGEARMAASDEAESSRNTVSNNYIHDGGYVYAAGVGIWVAQSSRNVISHNEIHSLNYSGMSIGWNWGYQKNRTHHNTIEHNHVHHVVRGVLSDGGGIYTLGIQTGTVIRNNVFHDVFPYLGKPAMAWGIYLDQASSGLTIENNIAYNTLTGGIMNTGSPGNTITNNIFAHSGWQAAWRWKNDKDPPSRIERNIFYLTQGELFRDDGGQSDFKSKWNSNLYWRSDGKQMLFYEHSLEEWQAKGVGSNSIVANPGFIDAVRFDFRLRPNSPALKLGFKPIDTTHNGLIGPKEWVDLPKQAKFSPTVFPPLPPEMKPVALDDGFEGKAPGERPLLAKVYVEGKGDSVRVTDETAAGGKHSLKIVDVPGLEHIYNPHLFYPPHFRRGRARFSFDLRLEAGAVFVHEWRDSRQPYNVGPSLHIGSDGQMLANGKPLVKLPFGKWLHLELLCELGRKADGTYSMTLTFPGKSAKTFERLSCDKASFRRLDWLGFVSLTNDRSIFYLDNVKLDLEDN